MGKANGGDRNGLEERGQARNLGFVWLEVRIWLEMRGKVFKLVGIGRMLSG